MRKFLPLLVFSFFLLGGGGDYHDQPQQQMLPQGKITIQLPPTTPKDGVDWTQIIVASVSATAVVGAAWVGVRYNRKTKG